MQKDMLPENYYRTARKLLPKMDDAMRKVVECLLKRAEDGEKTDNLIVEVITEDRDLRKKFREALDMADDKTMGMDFSQLGGDVNSPSARQFICPEPGHNYINRIQKIGENPGICPIHKVALIPINQKRGC